MHIAQPRRYDLILFDIDGTLIGSSGDVEAPLWARLDAARDAGQRMVVCTGRPPQGIAGRVAERLGPGAPHIYHAGALLGPTHGPALSQSTLTPAVAREVVRVARERGWVVELYTPEGAWADAITPRGARHARVLELTLQAADLMAIADSGRALRAHWIVDPADAQWLLARPIAGAVQTSASSDALPGDAFISVTTAGCDKGSATRALIASLGLDPARCAAIGDSEGDAPMLDAVGHPFAMANSPASMLARYPALGHVDAHGALALWADVSR